MTTLTKIPVAPKPKNGADMPMAAEGKMELPFHYPSFSVGSKQMPEVDSLDPEGKYRLIIDVVMTSKESHRHMDTRGGFDITGYKVLKEKSPEEMSDKEFGEYQGKVLETVAKKHGDY